MLELLSSFRLRSAYQLNAGLFCLTRRRRGKGPEGGMIGRRSTWDKQSRQGNIQPNRWVPMALELNSPECFVRLVIGQKIQGQKDCSMHHDSGACTLVWQKNEGQKDVAATRRVCLFFCPVSFCQSSSRDGSSGVGAGRNLRVRALAAVCAANSVGDTAHPLLQARFGWWASAHRCPNRG